MVNNIKEIISDVLYVSKITKTKNKKIIIGISVLVSQLIAFSDIAIILFFTSIFSNLSILPEKFEYFNFLFEMKILLPLIIIFRYYSQYFQSVLIKKLELSVEMSLKNYLLSQLFENRNFSTADTHYYINTLGPHVAYFYIGIANFFNFFLQAFAFTSYLFNRTKNNKCIFCGNYFFIISNLFSNKKNKRLPAFNL